MKDKKNITEAFERFCSSVLEGIDSGEFAARRATIVNECEAQGHDGSPPIKTNAYLNGKWRDALAFTCEKCLSLRYEYEDPEAPGKVLHYDNPS